MSDPCKLAASVLPLLIFLFAASPSLAQNSKAANTRSSPLGHISYLNTAPGVKYVGSKVCAKCHTQIYNEFIKTDMGRSMELADEPAHLRRISSRVILHVERLNRTFEVFTKDGRLYQSEYQRAPDGSLVFRDTQQLAYAMGAGANGVTYVVQKGRYLFESPLSYYTQSHSWDLSPGYEFADYGFHRPVPAACIICHSGRPRPVSGRDGLYQSPPFHELAVGCENCHGPGELHVRQRLGGAPLPGGVDRSIVNPADLPGWLANNVCMICHQGGDTRVLQAGKTYADFRPGTPLNRTVAIFAMPFSSQNPPQSPFLQHYTLMIMSKCYRSSGGRMTCITCHDPHVKPSAASAPAYYRKKCLACHTEKSCALPLAVRLRKSPPDNCVGCHMPRQKLARISHSALTDHRIIAYADEPFPESAFHQMTPRLPDLVHVDRVPGGRLIDPLVLFRAYGELMTERSPYASQYRAKYNELLDQLARSRPHDPLILSALARRELHTPQGLAPAQEHLREALQQGSTLDSDYELYATLLARDGKVAEAVAALKRGIALNPYSTRLYKRLALDYIALHNYDEALTTMKAELNMFPEDSFIRSLVKRVESPGATPR